ncbi:MAG: hypothetical protein CM1200mP34_2250 [Verrucomicrobiales bacterium]|nr:MAG: hypothetical protein CM1200mP34_2250 [Verrucomicrobiales bacterium]
MLTHLPIFTTTTGRGGTAQRRPLRLRRHEIPLVMRPSLLLKGLFLGCYALSLSQPSPAGGGGKHAQNAWPSGRFFCPGEVLFGSRSWRFLHLACLAKGKAGRFVKRAPLPESRAVAEHYAKVRASRADHLIGLPLPEGHTIPRARLHDKTGAAAGRRVGQTQVTRRTGGINPVPRSCWGVPIRVDKDDASKRKGAAKRHLRYAATRPRWTANWRCSRS